MFSTKNLALLGAFTGTISFFVLLWNAWQERAMVKISAPHNDSNMFFEASVEQDEYPVSHRIVVFIRMENKSKLPVTMYEFSLTNEDGNTLISNSAIEAKGTYVACEIPGGASLNIELEKQQLRLPFTLSPYGFAEGYAFFVANIVPNNDDATKATFKAHSTRGTFEEIVFIKFPTIEDTKHVRHKYTY